MNPKITKLRAELQKNKSKISDLQVKSRSESWKTSTLLAWCVNAA